MLKPNNTNWLVWVVAGIGSYFAGGLVFYFCHFISNSYEASGIVAFASIAGAFLFILNHAGESSVLIEHPDAMLIDSSPVFVLAEIKEALACRHFGEHKWSMDNLNERKGSAFFSTRIITPATQNKPPKQCTLTLHVQTERISNGSSVVLNYEIIADCFNRSDALKLCKETTQYLQQQLSRLSAVHV